jgi:hypothetical protein
MQFNIIYIMRSLGGFVHILKAPSVSVWLTIVKVCANYIAASSQPAG